MFHTIKENLSFKSDYKPRLLILIPTIVIISLIAELPFGIILFLKDLPTLFKENNNFIYHDYLILMHPFLAILIVGILGPVVETILAQVIPIEIMKYFKFSSKYIVLFSALIFSIGHYQWGIVKCIDMFFIGIFYATVYLLCRRYSFKESFGVISSIHGLHNLIAVLVVIFYVFTNSVPIYEWGLRRACGKGDMKTIKFILNKPIDINNKSLDRGFTPLIIAAYNGYTEAVQYLLDHGAKVDNVDDSGSTALLYASLYGKTEVVKLLLNKGVNVNIRVYNEYTPLYYAEIKNYTEIARLLKEKGAQK